MKSFSKVSKNLKKLEPAASACCVTGWELAVLQEVSSCKNAFSFIEELNSESSLSFYSVAFYFVPNVFGKELM